jgi:DNA-binding beta-propeller fold protein YncE
MRAALGFLVMALVLAACGSGGSGGTATTAQGHLPAAEPGHDATASAHPAGRSVAVGSEPQGIAVDGPAGLVAVGVHAHPAAIVLLDAQTGKVVHRIPIAGAPRHLWFVAPRGPLLVPEERRDRLVEIALPSDRQRSFSVGDFPHAAAAGSGRVFVGNERGGTLSVITSDGNVHTVRGFTQPGGLAPVGSDMAVVDVGAFTLTLLDARDDRILGRLPAGRGPTHDAAANGRIYVVDTRGDAILTYTASPFRQIGRTPLPGSPYGVAIDAVHHRLWVTETAENRLAELNLSGRLPRVIATFATGVQPDTVAVDSASGRVFVANQVSGTVELIDPPTS